MRYPAILLLTAALLTCDSDRVGPYEVDDLDLSHIVVVKRTAKGPGIIGHVVVAEQVVSSKKVGEYLLVRRKVAELYECFDSLGRSSFTSAQTDKDEYWVLDGARGLEHGPFSEIQYFRFLADNSLARTELKTSAKHYVNSADGERPSGCGKKKE